MSDGMEGTIVLLDGLVSGAKIKFFDSITKGKPETRNLSAPHKEEKEI